MSEAPPPYHAQGDQQYPDKAQPPAQNPYYSNPPQALPAQQHNYGPPQPYAGQPPPQGHHPGYMPPQAVPGQPQYAPQPAYVQPAVPYQQPATVIISQPVRPSYGPAPCTIKCPQCNMDVTTSTKTSIGAMVWIVAGIICAVGLFFPCLWLGCCLIPICIPSLQDVTHSCPSCNATLGHFKRAF